MATTSDILGDDGLLSKLEDLFGGTEDSRNIHNLQDKGGDSRLEDVQSLLWPVTMYSRPTCLKRRKDLCQAERTHIEDGV